MVQTRKQGSGDRSREIAALPNLSRPDLKQRWEDLFGMPAPRFSQTLLARAIAHRLQENVLGGLPPSARRLLSCVRDDVGSGREPVGAMPVLKPGMRLVREWHGATYEVVIVEDGVRYDGKVWRSLSAVARHITGTPRSGPAFFGLKK